MTKPKAKTPPAPPPAAPAPAALAVWKPKTTAELAALPDAERRREEALRQVHEQPELKRWYDEFRTEVRDKAEADLAYYHRLGSKVIAMRAETGHGAAALVAAAVDIDKRILSSAEGFARFWTLEAVNDMRGRHPTLCWYHFRLLVDVRDDGERNGFIRTLMAKKLSGGGLHDLIVAKLGERRPPDPQVRSFWGGTSNAHRRLTELRSYLELLDEPVFDHLEKYEGDSAAARETERMLEEADHLHRDIVNTIEALQTRRDVVAGTLRRLRGDDEEGGGEMPELIPQPSATPEPDPQSYRPRPRRP